MYFISSLCSKKKRIGEAVCELAELGFKNIELTGGTLFYEGFEDELIELREKYALSYMVHNYFPPPREDFVLNLASRKSEIKEKILLLIKEALRLSRIFAKNLYTMHPGFVNEVLPELKDNFFVKDAEIFNSREDFYKMLSYVADEVVPEGMKVAVENLSLKSIDDEFSFLCGRDSIKTFLDFFSKNKNVGMLLDLGHLNIASTIFGFDRDLFLEELVKEYSEKIFAFHLSGNDGYTDLHAPISCDSWHLKYLKKHKKTFKNVPVVFEWHDTANKETYSRFQDITEVLTS